MESTRYIVEIPRDGTIVEAQAIRAQLLAALADMEGSVLQVGLSGVEIADVTLVQLLLASEKTALAGGGRVLLDASPVVCGLLCGVGLAGWPGAAGF